MSVNDRPVSDGGEVLSALRGIAPYRAHHSHPTIQIQVDVRGPTGSLTLKLGRDSGNAREYWVFLSGHGVTSKNEIGRITTSMFDQY